MVRYGPLLYKERLNVLQATELDSIIADGEVTSVTSDSELPLCCSRDFDQRQRARLFLRRTFSTACSDRSPVRLDRDDASVVRSEQ